MLEEAHDADSVDGITGIGAHDALVANDDDRELLAQDADGTDVIGLADGDQLALMATLAVIG
jgi:hypothetical protein